MAQILVDPHTWCGEVALVASSCLAARRTFGDLAGDVAAGRVVVALLGDAGEMEHAVDAPVAAVVEPVPNSFAVALDGGQRDRASAQISTGGSTGSASFSYERRGDRPVNAGFVAPRGSVLVQSAGNARAIATASTTSVFASRRLRRAFAEHCGGTSRASNPASTNPSAVFA